jgi:molecular chaperone DnaK (HSP70)
VESTAAALAYGLAVAGNKRVMVFDIGGGTTDVSILHIVDGIMTVEYTGGDNNLGGQRMDQRLFEWISLKLQEGSSFD